MPLYQYVLCALRLRQVYTCRQMLFVAKARCFPFYLRNLFGALCIGNLKFRAVNILFRDVAKRIVSLAAAPRATTCRSDRERVCVINASTALRGSRCGPTATQFSCCGLRSMRLSLTASCRDNDWGRTSILGNCFNNGSACSVTTIFPTTYRSAL